MYFFTTGPTPTKQFKNAILDGEEDKAIDLYTASETDKALWHELPPSKRFPSKKHQKQSSETPLHMAASRGLLRLFVTLMGKGGDPTVLNDRLETCLHSVCSSNMNSEARGAIMEILVQWRGTVERGNDGETVSLNKVDVDGNTPIHLAAQNGLLECVEKLIALGAIISIVNKSNRTCCELADESQHTALALALELALVFQPVDSEMQEFVSHQNFPYDGVPGRMLLSGESFEDDQALENFIDEAITRVSEALWATNRNAGDSAAVDGKESADSVTDGVHAAARLRPRAEVLLTSYAWNAMKLIQEYNANPAQMLASARLQPFPSAAPPAIESAGMHTICAEQCPLSHCPGTVHS
jgi:ankyrin repeat protein